MMPESIYCCRSVTADPEAWRRSFKPQPTPHPHPDHSADIEACFIPDDGRESVCVLCERMDKQ